MAEPSSEREGTSRITLEPRIASALGNALTTQFTSPLERARKATSVLKERLVDRDGSLGFVRTSINDLLTFIDNLQTSKTVEITPGLWTMHFSEEKKSIETPKPGIIETDYVVARVIISVMNHFVNNNISGLSFAEMIRTTDSKSMQSINEISGVRDDISNSLKKSFHPDTQSVRSLQFITNEAGETTVEPIFNPTPSHT